MSDTLGIPDSIPTRYTGPDADIVPIKRFPRRPLTTDKKFPLGQMAILGKNPSTGSQGELWYLAYFDSSGNAIWQQIVGATISGISRLESDQGPTGVGPDGFGTVKVLGGTGISTSGQNPSTTLTVAVNTSVVTTQYNANTGSATPTAGIIVLSGGTGVTTAAATNTVTFSVDLTELGNVPTTFQTGSGNATPASNILILTGGTGISTSGSGNTVTFAVDLTELANVATSYTTDSGSAVPAANVLQVLGGSGISTSGSGNTVTVALTGGGIATQKFTVDQVTAPGVNPVVPVPATGIVTVSGAAVAAHSVPLETRSRAANAFNIELQYASAQASSTANASGISHYSTNDFTVDANGYVRSKFNSTAIGVINIGIKYTASTFTVTSSNGTALSSSNPGYVTLQSKSNPGQLVTVTVTADQTFIDDTGASTIAGNTFGFTNTDTTASNDVPFYLYAVLNDAENAVSFMISRTISLSTSAATIGKTGSAVATKSYYMFALDNPTVTDYDSNPCLMIGSFRMRLTTAPGDWTVQALSFTDGIGQYQENRVFTLPTGVFGAAASSYIRNNGGTAPQFNGQNYYYTLDRSGKVQINFGTYNVSVNGAGAVYSWLILPFPPYYPEPQNLGAYGRIEGTGPAISHLTGFLHEDATAGYIEITRVSDVSVEIIMFNNEFTVASGLASFIMTMNYSQRTS